MALGGALLGHARQAAAPVNVRERPVLCAPDDHCLRRRRLLCTDMRSMAGDG